MAFKFRAWTMSAALSFAAIFTGCSPESTDSSNTLVTDVNHTIVKRQSIGNCWLYAQATWLESLLLDKSGEATDVSESYWTWWHWYEQIVGTSVSEIETGGSWRTSARIALAHGWVTEGEFISGEQDVEMSVRQAVALNALNAALSSGNLDTRAKRTPENVRKVLDEVFGTDMAKAESISRSAALTDVGNNTTLEDALRGTGKRWTVVDFPQVYGKKGRITARVKKARKAVLQRVMKALNDKKPVVMTLMIDFNALDINDQTFKKSLIDTNGIGGQGGHMVVLEDYTVTNAPGFGDIGEGDVSDDMKAAALEGDIVLLKAKNSWGKDRPDRGLTDGYTRFDAAYLFSQLEWKYGEDEDNTSFYTTLTDFVLPPGY